MMEKGMVRRAVATATMGVIGATGVGMAIAGEANASAEDFEISHICPEFDGADSEYTIIIKNLSATDTVSGQATVQYKSPLLEVLEIQSILPPESSKQFTRVGTGLTGRIDDAVVTFTESTPDPGEVTTDILDCFDESTTTTEQPTTTTEVSTTTTIAKQPNFVVGHSCPYEIGALGKYSIFLGNKHLSEDTTGEFGIELTNGETYFEEKRTIPVHVVKLGFFADEFGLSGSFEDAKVTFTETAGPDVGAVFTDVLDCFEDGTTTTTVEETTTTTSQPQETTTTSPETTTTEAPATTTTEAPTTTSTTTTPEVTTTIQKPATTATAAQPTTSIQLGGGVSATLPSTTEAVKPTQENLPRTGGGNKAVPFALAALTLGGSLLLSARRKHQATS